jgi:hypothetical protein
VAGNSNDSQSGYDLDLTEDWDGSAEPDQSAELSQSADSEWPADQGRTSQRWLLLVYRVPPEPSRLRATVWRRIKRLGAIYLRSSAAGLPESPSAEMAMRKLRSEIIDMSGSAVLLSCEVLAGEPDIRAAFQSARNDEYGEIVDKCDDFLAGIDKEYAENHLSYAELEENEIDLVKLRKWLKRVRDRDAFGAEGLQLALSALADCEKKLEDYAARVYAHESARH